MIFAFLSFFDRIQKRMIYLDMMRHIFLYGAFWNPPVSSNLKSVNLPIPDQFQHLVSSNLQNGAALFQRIKARKRLAHDQILLGLSDFVDIRRVLFIRVLFDLGKVYYCIEETGIGPCGRCGQNQTEINSFVTVSAD